MDPLLEGPLELGLEFGRLEACLPPERLLPIPEMLNPARLPESLISATELRDSLLARVPTCTKGLDSDEKIV